MASVLRVWVHRAWKQYEPGDTYEMPIEEAHDCVADDCGQLEGFTDVRALKWPDYADRRFASKIEDDEPVEVNDEPVEVNDELEAPAPTRRRKGYRTKQMRAE